MAGNHFHNSLRVFDVLPNFPFTISETMRDYYLEIGFIHVVSQVAARLNTESKVDCSRF